MYLHTLMHYTMAHYKSNPIVLAVSSIYSQIPHTLCFFPYCDPRVFPKAKIPHVEITKLRHSIYSSNSVFFFVIIQKQKLSISSLSELVKKAESPKILLLNFFREIIFTKKLFSRKIQFFYSDNNKMYVYYCFTSHEFLHPRPHRYHLRQFHHGSHH